MSSAVQAMKKRDRGPQYKALPAWLSSRYWETAETTRLNTAHWTHAEDRSVNVWLELQLPTLRSRATYETRNNGIIAGMQNTHADDVVGQDGPTLQVQSSNKAYNDALEAVWRDWFSSPATRHNISGAQLLKLWVRNLWRNGEILARIVTDPAAEGAVSMRLLPTHPRRLVTPSVLAGNGNVVMGIMYDELERPVRYYIQDQQQMGIQDGVDAQPYPPDLIIHEFLLDEESQTRGIPWHATGIQTAADIRDYDDQVQDAARLMAESQMMLYTESPDAPYWDMPESSTFERRTIRMAPPHWKPFVSQSSQPPVQYPDYRAERQIELGRPVGMPRLMVRLDASKHSWASARLDMTTYRRSVACLQAWLSGSTHATGILTRLVDLVSAEARFSVPLLRNRPADVQYHWDWPQIDDVEPAKTAQANQTDLATGCKTLTEILANRKKTLTAHIEERRREIEAFEAAGIPVPAWGSGTATTQTVDNLDVPNETEEVDDEVGEEVAA